MPYISVRLATDGNGGTTSAAVAQCIGELTRHHLRKDPSVTAVAVDHVEARDWFIGGQSLAEVGVGTFWLDVKVTQGTNTKGEISAYLEAVYAEMAKLLGGISPTSYTVVHEVPAANWGFGGKTQEYRFVHNVLTGSA